MMNISSILCTVYGKNLESEFFNQFGRLFQMTGPLLENFFLWPWSVKI